MRNSAKTIANFQPVRSMAASRGLREFIANGVSIDSLASPVDLLIRRGFGYSSGMRSENGLVRALNRQLNTRSVG